MTDGGADFDRHAGSYRDEVSASVSFSGREVDYFAERKAIHLLDLVRRRQGDPSKLHALDVGCGVGMTDAHLVGDLGSIDGIDLSEDSVAEARERNPAATYRSYPGGALPYPEARFDLSFAVCVLHHVDPPDRDQFVAEMARVVRPGGLVVVIEHNPLNPLTRVAVRNCEFDEGVQLLQRSEVARRLTGAGLEIVEQRFIMFTPVKGSSATTIDRALRWVPFGAQHYVAARRVP